MRTFARIKFYQVYRTPSVIYRSAALEGIRMYNRLGGTKDLMCIYGDTDNSTTKVSSTRPSG